MSDSNGGGVFGLVLTIVSLWVLWYTIVDPTLWAKATSLSSPLDVLAQALVIVFTIIGIVEVIAIVIIVGAIILVVSIKIVAVVGGRL